MTRSIELRELEDRPCWNCGEEESSALVRKGDMMVYVRLCSECWAEASSLQYPEKRRWFSVSQVKKRGTQDMNKELLSEWSRLTKTQTPMVNWPKLNSVLKNVRRYYSQDDLLAMLEVAAEDKWVQSERPPLSAVLSADQISKWVRHASDRQRSEAAADKFKLTVAKLQMIEEVFGTGKLTSEVQQQIDLASSEEELDAVKEKVNGEQ